MLGPIWRQMNFDHCEPLGEAIQRINVFGLPRRSFLSPSNDENHGTLHSPSTIYYSLRPAFTLAEVLITLTVIGVVAALTIPTLYGNIQEYQFKQATKSAFSRASQAIVQMRNDNGGDFSSYEGNYRTFKPEFMKYFKVIQDCGLSTCVGSTAGISKIYKSLTGEGAASYRIDEGQFVTADGMFWGIENETAQRNIMITVDVNGYGKEPNIYGRDVFMFQLVNGNLKPMGLKDNPGYTFALPNYCNRTNHSDGQGFGCFANVLNGIYY